MEDFSYLVQESLGLHAKLEAIIMPMRGGLEQSIDLQRHEQKKVEVEEIPAEVMA
jgi:phosphotransferase system HPr-like phosphotransfer protein